MLIKFPVSRPPPPSQRLSPESALGNGGASGSTYTGSGGESARQRRVATSWPYRLMYFSSIVAPDSRSRTIPKRNRSSGVIMIGTPSPLRSYRALQETQTSASSSVRSFPWHRTQLRLSFQLSSAFICGARSSRRRSVRRKSKGPELTDPEPFDFE